MKKLLALTCLALLPFATLSAKSKAEKADFSSFKGNYTGTALLTITPSSGAGETESGLVSLNISAPGKGRSATITLNGSLSDGMSTAQLSGVFFLTKSTLTLNNTLLGLDSVPGFTIPGKLSAKGFKATGATVISTTPVTIVSSVKVKPSGKKKKKITVLYVLNFSGGSYTFQFTGIGKVRK